VHIFIITGNGEQSIPEGDGIRGNNNADKSNNSEKLHHINLDWREFRAKLYRDELVINSLLNMIYICHVLLLLISFYLFFKQIDSAS
jgi:hypothetical protein